MVKSETFLIDVHVFIFQQGSLEGNEIATVEAFICSDVWPILTSFVTASQFPIDQHHLATLVYH